MRPFQTTSPTGLRRDLPVMALWRKAKRLGTWDPEEVDLAQDRRDWLGLDEGERDVLLRLTALFCGGEESVTRELLPLMKAVAAEGRLEEEMFLAAFLWEEAKHVETFRRFFDEVAEERSDLSRYHTPCYERIFHEELPAAMGRLETDASPQALAEASATYNMVVEGVLAETGYQGYRAILERRGLMPGMQELVARVQRDESRHLAYGVYLLSRLVAEHGDPVWEAIEARMTSLLDPALGVIAEIFALYDPMPFGLEPGMFVDYALGQFQKRMDRVERARGLAPEAVTLAQEEGLAGTGTP